MSIRNLIAQHESRLTRTINLVASENLVSQDVRRALSSDVSMRYCIPPEGERPAAIWDYPNQADIRAIASETEDLARELFHATYADARPLSGNQVAQIILMSLVERGDTVWSVPADCGGHFATPVIARREGLVLLPIPYDRDRGIIDVEAASQLARKHPPRLIFLDASMQVFPHPVAALREALGPDTIISYDASHTMGLIAGGHFQAPLLEGADLLHGSTHKSLWGPQKGLITVGENSTVAARIRDAVVPLFVSNVHVHHVAALGIALEEARDHGPAYARDVIANAQALATSLSERGVEVLFARIGATASHQVLVDLGNREASLAIWNRLQAAGLNTNAISLPFRPSFGLRLGVAEATRRGLGQSEMSLIATWIAACIAGRGSVEAIANEVAEMSARFSFIRHARQTTPIV
jgi:glycine hydroxymethyltransferase